MYELIQVSDHAYYIQCPAKMGLAVSEGGRAYLIDSGNDRDTGRILAEFEENMLLWRRA